ncbi:hypothetical protein M0813_12617 [Anaeramoeba flamelloides]|uniref:Uncharacterized protein n=1 Tax=Anaeramoeba flamelloides TaxID=1746091 RepID=A0ABQ8ZAZ3_9EUKA|nr:hypothetical protein M0813_12617 [Anaeramoeba flamelloides]
MGSTLPKFQPQTTVSNRFTFEQIFEENSEVCSIILQINKHAKTSTIKPLPEHGFRNINRNKNKNKKETKQTQTKATIKTNSPKINIRTVQQKKVHQEKTINKLEILQEEETTTDSEFKTKTISFTSTSESEISEDSCTGERLSTSSDFGYDSTHNSDMVFNNKTNNRRKKFNLKNFPREDTQHEKEEVNSEAKVQGQGQGKMQVQVQGKGKNLYNQQSQQDSFTKMNLYQPIKYKKSGLIYFEHSKKKYSPFQQIKQDNTKITFSNQRTLELLKKTHLIKLNSLN